MARRSHLIFIRAKKQLSTYMSFLRFLSKRFKSFLTVDAGTLSSFANICENFDIRFDFGQKKKEMVLVGSVESIDSLPSIGFSCAESTACTSFLLPIPNILIPPHNTMQKILGYIYFAWQKSMAISFNIDNCTFWNSNLSIKVVQRWQCNRDKHID